MAINYTWDCKTVEVKNINGNEDTVFNVHWRLTAENDKNNMASIYGSQKLDTSDLSSFIAFKDITIEQITNWTKNAIGENKVAEIKNNLSDQISELISPTKETKTIGK